MDIGKIIDNSIYGMLALVGLYGVFQIILLLRRIRQKRFASEAAAQQFLDDVRGMLEKRDFQGVADLCDSPPYWSKVVPQLMLVALDNRNLGPAALRRLLGERFERDVLSDLEYRMSWVATCIKCAPMLGLLGTVVGMINAFGKIAAASSTGTDPKSLAYDISFALFTTAIGLMIAIPLVMAGNMIRVRMGKLQDDVQQHLGEFVEDLNTVVGDMRGTGT